VPGPKLVPGEVQQHPAAAAAAAARGSCLRTWTAQGPGDIEGSCVTTSSHCCCWCGSTHSQQVVAPAAATAAGEVYASSPPLWRAATAAASRGRAPGQHQHGSRQEAAEHLGPMCCHCSSRTAGEQLPTAVAEGAAAVGRRRWLEVLEGEALTGMTLPTGALGSCLSCRTLQQQQYLLLWAAVHMGTNVASPQLCH
jgi:hypothetical protein